MGRLDGKVIIVTGAAGGMGACHVRMMVEEGAKLVACDIAADEGAALAAAVPGDCLFHPLDVTDEGQWQDVVRAAVERFGRVDALVNNAGIMERGALLDTPADRFRRTLDINLTGAFLGIRAVEPHMPAQGGVIVNISSVAGLAGYPSAVSYVASKWGLRGLTKTAAIELGGRGIRVVSVHPGPIRTPMAVLPEEILQSRPIPRAGEPEEVSKMVIFAIAEATFTTGSEFVIDGGLSSAFG